MNIFVGNLSPDVTDDELYTAFAAFGPVASAKIVMDRFTNRSRGFGFVEMNQDLDAQAAIAALDSTLFAGREVRVNEARTHPNAERSADFSSHT